MCSSTTQGQTYLCSSHGRWVCAVSRRSDRNITRLGSCNSYRLGGSVVSIRFGDFLRRRDCDSYRIAATVSLRRGDSLGFGDPAQQVVQRREGDEPDEGGDGVA